MNENGSGTSGSPKNAPDSHGDDNDIHMGYSDNSTNMNNFNNSTQNNDNDNDNDNDIFIEMSDFEKHNFGPNNPSRGGRHHDPYQYHNVHSASESLSDMGDGDDSYQVHTSELHTSDSQTNLYEHDPDDDHHHSHCYRPLHFSQHRGIVCLPFVQVLLLA